MVKIMLGWLILFKQVNCVQVWASVYTIGLGNGIASMPVGIDPNTKKFVYRPVQVTIDEALLKRIAEMTNSQYFRATDRKLGEYL